MQTLLFVSTPLDPNWWMLPFQISYFCTFVFIYIIYIYMYFFLEIHMYIHKYHIYIYLFAFTSIIECIFVNVVG